MSGYVNQFAGLVSGLVQTAIQITGDLASAIVYSSQSDSVYTPSTGAVSNTPTVITLNGVVTKFSNNEIDDKIVIATDAKLIVAALDLSVDGTPIEPRENDTLTANGRSWKVCRVWGVPGQGMWKIQIRET